MTCNLTVG